MALEKVYRCLALVDQADGERALRRLGKLDCLGCMFGRVGELAELGETSDQLAPIEDRYRHRGSEMLVHGVGRDRCEVGCGPLDCPLIFAPMEVRRTAIACGKNSKSQVP